MDGYRDMFRVILELSNDKASSAVYFMLAVSCLTARTHYYRMKANSAEVVNALAQKEHASPSLISGQTGIRIYYLDGYHVTLDVKSETTIKDLCAQVMHGMKMGLYEVENEFGPAHEQRLLDGDMTVGQLAARWKSMEWPNAKLIAPIYLKEWSTGSPERQVQFENALRQSPARPSRSPSPATFLNAPHSPPIKSIANQVTTPENTKNHGTAPSSASPGSGSRSSRHRSPGTTARVRTNALLNTLFNNTQDEPVPRRRAEKLITHSASSPASTAESAAAVESASVAAPAVNVEPVVVAASPARKQSPTAASPSSAARRDAAPSRRQSSSHSAVSPRMNTSSTLRTANTARTLTPNRDGRYGFYSRGGDLSASSTDSSMPSRSEPTVIVPRRSQSPVTSPKGRQLTYPREVVVSRSTTPTNTAGTQTPAGVSPVSPERNFSPSRERAVVEVAAAQEPEPVSEAAVQTLSQEIESEFVPVPVSSPEKIRPRTTYVQIAGSTPVEGLSTRASFESAEDTPSHNQSQDKSNQNNQNNYNHIQTPQSSTNIFDLNNSPPLVVPVASLAAGQAPLVKPEETQSETKEGGSPTTTSSTSGTNTPSGGNGLSPYPSWRGSSSALASAPDLTVTTPPQAAPIHALYSRLFGAPAENDFTLPLSPVATSQYHSPPKPKEIVIASLESAAEALPRYSRSSSPTGSVGSNADSVTSAGGTRRLRSKSGQVFVRPPFDTTYNGPTLSELLSVSGDGTHAGPSVAVSDAVDEQAASTDNDTTSLLATPAPAVTSSLPPRYATPNSIRKTPAPTTEGSANKARTANSATRLPRKVSSSTMSESESSQLSHGSRGAPRPSAGVTPGSATHKKKTSSAHSTPQATVHSTPQSTVDKLKRASKAGAAFGHCITPTSAQIRESFEARHYPGLTAEQIASGLYTQSYAQLNGGYVPHRRPSGNNTGANGTNGAHSGANGSKHADTEHSPLDSEHGAHSATRKSRARSDSPHSVHSGGAGGGSRSGSALRTRNPAPTGTWRP